MNTEKLLKEAIRLRKPIEFEYNREEGVRGKRTGNPHILFVHSATNKKEIENARIQQASDKVILCIKKSRVV